MDAAQFASAYALTTSIGLRPFLTLALASLAMHFGYLHPSHPFAYLGTDGATVVLAVLAILEFAGDKVPAVDNALHVVHFAIKPVAAAILVGSALPDTSGTGAYAAMGLGALNALGVHTASATARGASTAMTVGVANPVLSFAEDGMAVVTVVAAFAAPFLAAFFAVLITCLLAIVAIRVVRLVARRRAR
ncbi:MAG: DUF4126 domain-containing protein [Candidatus Baltobacteraceae bacterium]